MGKLIRMDLYRMMKERAFLICLLLTFLLALGSTPFARLIYSLANTLSVGTVEPFPAETNLSVMISDPFPVLGFMLLLLSLCFFFYADMENGYIKNIAGQMPMKGFTVLSKFMAAAVHNLIFIAVSIIGSIIGTLIFQRIVMDAGVPDSFRVLALKFLLIQSICAILLLVVTTLRAKSLGMVLAVLFGLGLTSLIYLGINQGLNSLFGGNIDIAQYMPDTVMSENPLGTLKALAVAVVTGFVFLLPAIRIFDRRDVK